jgi:hypothetical protein
MRSCTFLVFPVERSGDAIGRNARRRHLIPVGSLTATHQVLSISPTFNNISSAVSKLISVRNGAFIFLRIFVALGPRRTKQVAPCVSRRHQVTTGNISKLTAFHLVPLSPPPANRTTSPDQVKRGQVNNPLIPLSFFFYQIIKLSSFNFGKMTGSTFMSDRNVGEKYESQLALLTPQEVGQMSTSPTGRTLNDLIF